MNIKIGMNNLNGIYKEIANILGIEAAKKMHEEYRGQQITFPMEIYNKEYIYSQIINEYDGNNIKKLASKYEYSERTIRRIIKNLK